MDSDGREPAYLRTRRPPNDRPGPGPGPQEGVLTDLVGGNLPAAVLDTAKDSVGGGLAVAEQVAKNPQGGPQQAQTLVDAVHESFAHAIAHASLVGGIVMAVGTVVVLVVLPGRKADGKHHQEKPAAPEADQDGEYADSVR